MERRAERPKPAIQRRVAISVACFVEVYWLRPLWTQFTTLAARVPCTAAVETVIM